MNKKRVFTSLASAVLLSAGLVGTSVAVNPDFGIQTVQAARHKKLKVLPFKQTKYQFVMKSNHAVYNSKGKRLNIPTIKKGRQVNAKGIKTIKGRKYADLGYGQFVKIAGTKMTMWQGSNPISSNNTNNSGSRPNTNTSTNTGKNTSNNSSKNNSSSSNTTSKPNKPSSSSINVEHVKQLAMQKINAWRTQHEWYSHPELHEKLQAYKSNSEIQRLADERAKELSQPPYGLAHVRPNGTSMEMPEFRRTLPSLGQEFKLGRFSTAGENVLFESLQGPGYSSAWLESDEDVAEEIFKRWSEHPGHRETLLSEDARVGYGAVGIYYSAKDDGWYCAFEMAGANYWANEK